LGRPAPGSGGPSSKNAWSASSNVSGVDVRDVAGSLDQQEPRVREPIGERAGHASVRPVPLADEHERGHRQAIELACDVEAPALAEDRPGRCPRERAEDALGAGAHAV
jgi:hypothetical protein